MRQLSSQPTYRAVELEELMERHRAEHPKASEWRVPSRPRADCRAWLIVDTPRGPVSCAVPGDKRALGDAVDDLREGSARWVQIMWRVSYDSGEWTFVPSEGWRNQRDDDEDDWFRALEPEDVPLGVLQVMRDLDARVAASGEGVLDRILERD